MTNHSSLITSHYKTEGFVWVNRSISTAKLTKYIQIYANSWSVLQYSFLFACWESLTKVIHFTRIYANKVDQQAYIRIHSYPRKAWTNITAFTLAAYQRRSLQRILTISSLGACLALRCFQRFSVTNVATQHCHWCDNWHTIGSLTTVLSY